MLLATDCAVCGKAIKGTSERVMCFGPCGLIKHLKCSEEVDKAGLKAIESNLGVKYMCHGCRGQQISYNSVLEKCNEIMEKMQENDRKMDSFLTQINEKWEEEMNAKIDKVVQQLKGDFLAIVEKYEEESKKAEKRREETLEKLVEKCVEKKKKEKTTASQRGSSRNQRELTIDVDNEESQEQPPKPPEKELFSDAVKNNTNQSEQPTEQQPVQQQEEKSNKVKKKKLPVIIVKPKEADQSTKTTKSELRNQLDRKASKISEVREGTNGKVILGIEKEEDVESVRKTVAEKLGGRYEVSVPQPRKPRLKVVGAEENYEEEKLIESIIRQNDCLEEIELKLVTSYQSVEDSDGNRLYNFIIEVDEISHEIMLTMGRVFIGWSRCRVFECYGIIRCFKCCGYGHKSTACQNQETCARCTGPHKTKECKSQKVRCANCEHMNRTRKLNLDVEHSASSYECPTYQKIVSRRRQMVGNDR